MGQGLRFARTPDGQVMTQPAYNQYMQNVYNPQQDFNASASAPIPGVTGGYGTGATIPGLVGRAPPQQPIPAPMPTQFHASGPYGQQAMRMAGLLGNVPTPQQPTMGYQGLLGGPPPQAPPSQGSNGGGMTLSNWADRVLAGGGRGMLTDLAHQIRAQYPNTQGTTPQQPTQPASQIPSGDLGSGMFPNVMERFRDQQLRGQQMPPAGGASGAGFPSGLLGGYRGFRIPGGK